MPVCAACLSEPRPLSAEHFCASCRTPFVNASPLGSDGRCPLCRLGLRGFDAAYTFGAYEGVLQKLIHLYKYSKIRTLAKPLGDFLAAALPRTERFDLVTAVPLHWRKQWERGFNQSEDLAREAARRYGMPVSRLLRRKRATAAQAGMVHRERRRNVNGAFQMRRGASVAGLRVLLIDDVMTTGATGGACAQVLKKAGAARAALLTLARVDRRWLPSGDSGRRQTAYLSEGVPE